MIPNVSRRRSSGKGGTCASLAVGSIVETSAYGFPAPRSVGCISSWSAVVTGAPHRSAPLLLVVATLLSAAPSLCGRERQVLVGHTPKAIAQLRPVDRLAATNELRLAIGLPLRNREALTNCLEQLYEPKSPQYHHYLTVEQFTEAYGPTKGDYQAVVEFVKANGLTVTATHPNRMMVSVSGSVADIETALHVTMRVYPHPTENRAFFAADGEPSLDLEVQVLHISGLDNYCTPRSMIQHAVPCEQAPNDLSLNGTGPGGLYWGGDFRRAYGVSSSLTGTGQIVGLVEFESYAARDITNYEEQVSIPYVPLEDVHVDFPPSPLPGGGPIVIGETALDIEMAISMAPGLSRVLVYEALLDSPMATRDHLLNRMATDNRASQLSCSWGFDISVIAQQVLLEYAAQGQSFFQASGDWGAYPKAVMQPTDNPNVTVVGGTILNTAYNRTWESEAVWEGSGGGISTLYPVPSWQHGVDMSTNRGSVTMRNLPDVAMVATDVYLIANGNREYWVGGTSIAAPLWAGFTALINQRAAEMGKPPVGFLNPALYAIGKGTNYGSSFHDITMGAITSPDQSVRFPAVPGYDLCTGWGSPNGTNLINAILSLVPETLLLTPPAGFVASGAAGGPFSVSSRTYSLTNTGTAALNWSLMNTSAWLTVSPMSGTLPPGAPPTTVTVSLNSKATNFLLGTYTATLTLSNLNDGSRQNREFRLFVGNGGFERGDFTDWVLLGNSDVNFVDTIDWDQFIGRSSLPGADNALFTHTGVFGALLGQSNSIGSLSHSVPTVPGRPYRISFWLANPSIGVTNEFRALWNGEALFTQTNRARFAWTNLQYIVTAQGTNGLLEFQFQSEQFAAFGLDDISVEAVSRTIGVSGNLTFGDVVVGTIAQAAMTIDNRGEVPLTVSNVSYPNGFSGAWSGTIPPGGSQPVTVTFAPTAVGNYDGLLTVSSDSREGNNSLAVSGTGTPVGAIVLLDPDSLNTVYDGSPKTVSARTTPEGLALRFTYDGGSNPPVAAGTHLVAASIDDPQFTGSASGTLTVAPAPLTVTAESVSRAYGTDNPSFSTRFSGLVNGERTEVISGVPAFSTSATVASPVGTCLIVVGVGTLSASNYSFGPFVDGVLTIAPAALTVTAHNVSRAYGVANPVLDAAYSGIVNGDTAAVLSGAPAFSTPATIASSVGAYPIVPSVGTLSASNYSIGSLVPGILMVTPAALTVAANNVSRVYGMTNPIFTATYTGFANEDTPAVLRGTPFFSTSALVTSPVGDYPIVVQVGTLSASNYTLGAGADGILTVTPAALAVRANDASRTYGATNPAFSAIFAGFVNDEAAAIISGAPAFRTPAIITSPVGPYPIVPEIGTLSASNYSFGPFAEGTLTIVPAPLTVTANNASRAYGTTNPVFSGTLDGFVNNDTAEVISGAPTFKTPATVDSLVGTYPIVPETGTLTAANYSFEHFANGILTIRSNEIRLLNPTFMAGQFDLTVATDAGSKYILEYKTSLGKFEWQECQTLVGTGSVITLSDSHAEGPARFYRVRIE